MSDKNKPPGRGMESRFGDFSVDVRQERLVRYIIHQAQRGRHVKDIVDDPYVVAHFDEVARSRILEHPEVIKGIEEQIRHQFAGYGDSVGGPEASGGDQDSTGRTNDADVPDL
jgi:hypothetical protein